MAMLEMPEVVMEEAVISALRNGDLYERELLSTSNVLLQH